MYIYRWFQISHKFVTQISCLRNCWVNSMYNIVYTYCLRLAYQKKIGDNFYITISYPQLEILNTYNTIVQTSTSMYSIQSGVTDLKRIKNTAIVIYNVIEWIGRWKRKDKNKCICISLALWFYGPAGLSLK